MNIWSEDFAIEGYVGVGSLIDLPYVFVLEAFIELVNETPNWHWAPSTNLSFLRSILSLLPL